MEDTFWQSLYQSLSSYTKDILEFSDKTGIVLHCLSIPYGIDDYSEGIFGVIKELVEKTNNPRWVYEEFFGCIIAKENDSFYEKLDRKSVEKDSKYFWRHVVWHVCDIGCEAYKKIIFKCIRDYSSDCMEGDFGFMQGSAIAKGTFKFIKDLVEETEDPWFVYTKFFGCVVPWNSGSVCEIWDKDPFYSKLSKEIVKHGSEYFWGFVKGLIRSVSKSSKQNTSNKYNSSKYNSKEKLGTIKEEKEEIEEDPK